MPSERGVDLIPDASRSLRPLRCPQPRKDTVLIRADELAEADHVRAQDSPHFCEFQSSRAHQARDVVVPLRFAVTAESHSEPKRAVGNDRSLRTPDGKS